MKKNIWTIVAITMLFICSCKKECAENTYPEQTEFPQAKSAYPPIPSWARVSTAVSFLRSKTSIIKNCRNDIDGYFCGLILEEEAIIDGSAIVYHGSGEPYGIQIPNSVLISNNLSSIVDSAENGFLTFHADIGVNSEHLVNVLGFDLIPAGRYPAIILGDTAAYIQFI